MVKEKRKKNPGRDLEKKSLMGTFRHFGGICNLNLFLHISNKIFSKICLTQQLHVSGTLRKQMKRIGFQSEAKRAGQRWCWPQSSHYLVWGRRCGGDEVSASGSRETETDFLNLYYPPWSNSQSGR